jgi:hypothetical protein
MCKWHFTKIAKIIIDIETDDAIASDNDQCQTAGGLGYVKPQGIAKSQLFREQCE